MAKYRYYKEKLRYDEFFTQPNMSFTPRQILEQFASGEMIVQQNEPTDDFYDDNYSDDDLSNLNVVTDDFVARQFAIDFLIKSDENVKGGNSNTEGSVEPSTKITGTDSGTASSEPSGSEGSV